MDLDHGKQLDGLLQSVLERPPGERDAFLQHACAGDEPLERRVREFQKILDHRGIVGPDPIGVLAHLQLGRTFAFAGDQVKAKRAYDDFLTRWKDADADVPILVQAKAEYARLH